MSTARQLIYPTVRAVRWAPLTAGAALGLFVVAVPAALVELKPDGWATVLRLAALAAASGAAFILDDPSHPSTSVVPTSLLLRRTIRVALLLPLTALWWAAALLTLRTLSAARSDGDAATDALVGLPIGGLTIEAAALFAVAVAVAAAAGRTGDGGITGAVATVTAGLLAHLPQVGLVLAPGHPHWAQAHTIWALLTTAAFLAFAAANRDTGAPRLIRSTRPYRAQRTCPPPSDPGTAWPDSRRADSNP